MGFLLTLSVMAMLVGIPLMNKLEKKVIAAYGKEQLYLTLKSRPKKRFIAAYSLVGILVVAGVRPEEMTFSIGVLKMLFLAGLYLTAEAMRKKVYVTDRHVYLIRRFHKKTLISFTRWKQGQLYRIDQHKDNPLVYTLYYSDDNGYYQTLEAGVPNMESADGFEALMEKHLSLAINQPVRRTARVQAAWLQKLGMYARKSTWALLAFTALTGIWSDERDGTQMAASLLVVAAFPAALYLGAYVFLKTARLVETGKQSQASRKVLIGLYTAASSAVPFVIFINHANTTGERFLHAHVIGFGWMLVLMLTAWISGLMVRCALHLKSKHEWQLPAKGLIRKKSRQRL